MNNHSYYPLYAENSNKKYRARKNIFSAIQNEETIPLPQPAVYSILKPLLLAG